MGLLNACHSVLRMGLGMKETQAPPCLIRIIIMTVHVQWKSICDREASWRDDIGIQMSITMREGGWGRLLEPSKRHEQRPGGVPCLNCSLR